MGLSLLRRVLAALVALGTLSGAAAEDAESPAPPADAAATAPEPKDRPNPAAARAVSAALDTQLAALAAEVARDQERLKTLISEPLPEGVSVPGTTPEVREIARRLPTLQARLRALREERARLVAP